MVCRTPALVSLASLVAACAAVWSLPACGAEASPDFFQKSLRPFLENYCFDCHSGADAEAGIELDACDSVAALRGDRTRWQRVLRMVRGREMPPEDMPQPEPDQVEAITRWIDDVLNYVDCSKPVNPGRVTIRRLNRVEYGNTIRDLLGVEFDAVEKLPADDVGYGFDTIGDVLSLPPILMEKYLDAAEEIAGRAIVVDALDGVAVRRIEPAQASSTSGDGVVGAARVLASSGEVFLEHAFPNDAEYVFRIEAFAQQAGSEPAKMGLRLDGKELKTFDVEAVETEPAVYSFQAKIPAGEHRLSAAFLNDFYNPEAEDPSRRDRNLFVGTIEIVGPLRSGPEDLPDSHRRIFAAAKGAGKEDRPAAGAIVEQLVSRAYRRPARPQEVERLLGLFDLARQEGESFEAAVRLSLTGVLVSPGFLFKIERDPAADDPAAVRLLDEYELATRMAYFLWSSMPDDELFDEARSGTLRKNLDAQVRRMLADPKAAALVESFAFQWLQLRTLDTIAPDKKLFASFDDELRRAMLTESAMFFEAVLREDRSVLELIDADFTFLDERLARHYGVEGVEGDEFRRVSLAGSPRGGLLTQASVLTVTSNPTRTSPVKRGRWIMETILGTPPPEPPPNVPMLDESEAAILSGTLRERMELHRKKEECAVCHRKMDALGFAMENFDAVGAWRTHDGEFPIDASAVLPDGQAFNGPAELKAILRKSARDDFVRCLSEKMLIYALGRGLEYYDKCALDRITGELAKSEYRFSTLILEIVRSDPFQKRSNTTE